MVHEFATSLNRETDFSREARAIVLFRSVLADVPGLWIPDVVTECSSRTVLTLEFAAGERVDLYARRHPEVIPRSINTLVRLMLQMIFEEGLFHADPHPGNVFVLPDGRLALLDFGMTGELDEPMRESLTLKAADIGVAMGISGTDVSKAAADMILTDDNFATIVAAVGEGRAIVANIQKFLRFLLSSNIGEVLTMFGGVVLADVLGLTATGDSVIIAPLLATHMLWINLVTDGAPALALGLDPADPAVMQQQPRPQGSGVITRAMWLGIGLVGVIMATGTLLVLDAALPGGLIAGTGTMAYGRTMALTTLVLFQMFNVLNARSDTHSAFYRLFHNGWLFGAVALSLALHVTVLYVPLLQRAFDTVPLQGRDWLTCVLVASSVLWLRELSKAAWHLGHLAAGVGSKRRSTVETL